MNIFVGSLSSDTTEEDLQKAFEAFGQVKSVTIIKDMFSRESKGFGFVEIQSKAEAQGCNQRAERHNVKGKSA